MAGKIHAERAFPSLPARLSVRLSTGYKRKASALPPEDQTSNRLLVRLAPEDFALLKPHLTPVELSLRRNLERPDQPIEAAYFMETGLASVVATGGTGHDAEVGMIGKEGMTGLPLVLGDTRTIHQTFIQIAGQGWRVPVQDLARALEQSPSLHHHLLHYAQAFLIQMAFTALANARYKLDERLARWLLMAQDRIEAPKIALTHDFLAIMLGVRRAGVTSALNALQKANVVELRRGSILIINREELLAVAGTAYGGPEAQYARLFAPGAPDLLQTESRHASLN